MLKLNVWRQHSPHALLVLFVAIALYGAVTNQCYRFLHIRTAHVELAYSLNHYLCRINTTLVLVLIFTYLTALQESLGYNFKMEIISSTTKTLAFILTLSW